MQSQRHRRASILCTHAYFRHCKCLAPNPSCTASRHNHRRHPSPHRSSPPLPSATHGQTHGLGTQSCQPTIIIRRHQHLLLGPVNLNIIESAPSLPPLFFFSSSYPILFLSTPAAPPSSLSVSSTTDITTIPALHHHAAAPAAVPIHSPTLVPNTAAPLHLPQPCPAAAPKSVKPINLGIQLMISNQNQQLAITQNH
ncbi:hypothetical protein M0R45_019920 [Rubus argutus]|uniref:Uncharacterized protein n=1 Tax=Rubus argutus TaxID=59490 RepID=A0AAW1X8I4_RUBAR